MLHEPENVITQSRADFLVALNHFPTRGFCALSLRMTDTKARPRHDGWTIARQAMFLAALERDGNVRAAAAAVGMNRASAYRLRDRPDGRRFGRAWDAALARRRERALEERLMKATLSLGRADRRTNAGPARPPLFPRQGDKSDRWRETAPQGQSGQACRPSPRDPALLRALIDAACGDDALSPRIPTAK